MKNYPKYIKNTLNSVLRDMAKHLADFCRSPEKDFTRNRKLPFKRVLSLLLKMGGHSLRDEMLALSFFAASPIRLFVMPILQKKCIPHRMHSFSWGDTLRAMPLT